MVSFLDFNWDSYPLAIGDNEIRTGAAGGRHFGSDRKVPISAKQIFETQCQGVTTVVFHLSLETGLPLPGVLPVLAPIVERGRLHFSCDLIQNSSHQRPKICRTHWPAAYYDRFDVSGRKQPHIPVAPSSVVAF
ncbi:hypothetical protein D9M70_554880 [compost metagenome]